MLGDSGEERFVESVAPLPWCDGEARSTDKKKTPTQSGGMFIEREGSGDLHALPPCPASARPGPYQHRQRHLPPRLPIHALIQREQGH